MCFRGGTKGSAILNLKLNLTAKYQPGLNASVLRARGLRVRFACHGEKHDAGTVSSRTKST